MAIQFTMETGNKKAGNIESLTFLDIQVILRGGKFVTTNMYYKETTPHDYLNFHSAHPFHIKQTIPFNLAKRIIVFVSDPERMKFLLGELKNWLLCCEYPKDLIKQAFAKVCLNGSNLTWMVDDRKFLSEISVLNQIIWPAGYQRAAAWGPYSLLCT